MNIKTLSRPTGPIRFAPLLMWALLGAAAGFVLTFNPTDRIADPTGACLWHALFGVDGPSCGGTRMFFYLIHGNMVQATRHHLAAMVGLVYGGYALAMWTAGWLSGRAVRLWVPSRRTVAVYVGLFVVYSTVLRNLPWPPFDWFYVANLI